MRHGFEVWHDASRLEGRSDKEALDKLTVPTIIHTKGNDSRRAVLVSVIIHGCEPCGFRAMLKELEKKETYPIDVYWLVGNPKSAKVEPLFTNRLVPGGENYNRTWTAEHPSTEDQKLCADLWDHLTKLPIIAHLDLHSFTATDTSPHAITVADDAKTLDLAKKLAPYVFVMDCQLGALIERTRAKGPSLVVECGTNNSPEADKFAQDALERFFVQVGIRNGENNTIAHQVFVHAINVKVKPDASVVWANSADPKVKLTLRQDVAQLNIRELSKGDPLGWTDSLDCFKVLDKNGPMDPSEIFELKKGQILLKNPFVPNLMVAKETIAKESGFYLFTKRN